MPEKFDSQAILSPEGGEKLKEYMKDAYEVVRGFHGLAEVFARRSEDDNTATAKKFIADLKDKLTKLPEKHSEFIDNKEGFAPMDPQGAKIPRREVIERFTKELDDIAEKSEDWGLWGLDNDLYRQARELYFYIGQGIYNRHEEKEYEQLEK